MSKKKEEANVFDFNKSFVTDQDLEENGVWEELNMDGQTLMVKVARKNNPQYKKMLRPLMVQHKRKLEKDSESALRLFEDIMIKVMAKTILLDWGEGLVVNGEPLTHSVANAEMLLRNERFRTEIDSLSDDFDLYKGEQEDALKGN